MCIASVYCVCRVSNARKVGRGFSLRQDITLEVVHDAPPAVPSGTLDYFRLSFTDCNNHPPGGSSPDEETGLLAHLEAICETVADTARASHTALRQLSKQNLDWISHSNIPGCTSRALNAIYDALPLCRSNTTRRIQGWTVLPAATLNGTRVPHRLVSITHMAGRKTTFRAGLGDADAHAAFFELTATHAHSRKSEHHANSSHHAAWQSLAEVSSFLQAGVPGLDDIMEPILNLVLEPVTSQVISMVGSSAIDSIKNTLPDEMEGEVPEDVAECLNVALTHNLTSLLTDTVTATVATELVPALTETLFASLRKHALQRVVPWLLHQLEPSSPGSKQRRYKPNDLEAVAKPPQALTHAIRAVVAKEVTGRLHDALSLAILPRLTQTLTLSIVPPLVSRWHGVPRGLSAASCERAKKEWPEEGSGNEDELPLRVLCDPDSLSDVWANHAGHHYALYFARYYAYYYDTALQGASKVATTERYAQREREEEPGIWNGAGPPWPRQHPRGQKGWASWTDPEKQ